MRYEILHGDCLDVMQLCLDDNSVDAIVTDPPYGLGFMGKHWDHGTPGVEFWAEMLRILKPGGHLLAFAGTRTQHRMACSIEDAGFEIRDCIYWHYGQGFPKSHNLDGAWKGWGTALKPSTEPVTVAIKPCTDEQERHIIQSNLMRLEEKLWSLSSASAAGKSSTSNRSASGAEFGTAQSTAEESTNTPGVSPEATGMSPCASAIATSLNIVSSWRSTWTAICEAMSTFTTATASGMTTDLRTLSFCSSAITPENIILACTLPGGFNVNADIAAGYFNASLSLLRSTLELSAAAPAMSQLVESCQGVGGLVSTDHITVARKPLIGTVAENVLAHGTGAINVDGCRVETTDDLNGGAYSNGAKDLGKATSYATGVNAGAFKQPTGRWPANLIHDGSDEVVALFPSAPGQLARARTDGVAQANAVYGSLNHITANPEPRGDAGSAARFFYCAKASKKDRDEGLEGFEAKRTTFADGTGLRNNGDGSPRNQAPSNRNHHPTVKPTDLMRYLCRLVTPPGGIILDPFMGSGSTGKAAVLEGFRFIGIEREAEYIAIAEARIQKAAA